MKRKLSAAFVRNCSGPKEVWDSVVPGLLLRVSAKGSKVWGYRYRMGGHRRRVRLGRWPIVELAEARSSAREIASQVDKGIDTAAPQEQPKVYHFRDLAEEFLERHAKPRKKSWKGDQELIKAELLPAFGKKAADQVSRRDVIDLLDRITDRGAPVQANRTRALISSIFSFGMSRDLVPSNPAQGTPRNPEKSRDRVLSDEEIVTLWQALDEAPSLQHARVTPVIANALKFLLCTLQRRGELCSMERKHLAENWWTIPSDLSKNAESHRVYLAPLARSLVEDQIAESQGPVVFPSPRLKGRPLVGSSLDHAAKRLCEQHLGWTGEQRFRPHDLRRTGATRMAELGIDPFGISRVLNHKLRGITAVYVRSSFDARKKEALELWDRHLTSLVRSS